MEESEGVQDQGRNQKVLNLAKFELKDFFLFLSWPVASFIPSFLVAQV